MSKVVQLLKSILPFVSLLMFALVVYFIHTFLETHSFLSIKNELDSISGKQLFLAIATTVLAYTVLAFYDVLAFRYVNEKLSLGKILFGSFSAFAFSNSIGLANLAGSSIRLRIYTSYGVTFNKIAQVIAFVTMSFWLGFFALSGFVFIFVGLNIPPEYVVSPLIIRWIGVIFLIIVFTYLFYSAYSKQHLKIKSIQIELPNFKLSLAQIVVASTDWCLAGLTLYLLLPESTGLTFPVFLSIFLSAQVIALLTHIPGGLGILEGIVIYFVVPNHHATPAVVAALLLYRLLYYIAPLLLAGSGLVFYELYLRRQKVSSMAMGATAWVKPLAPICFSIFSFVSGATLLISGSTPNIQSRSEWLANMFPLSLLEISHFLGSCFGVVLIALSVSLFNRNRAAWLATLCSLWAGALLSILKGLDYEEAIILSLFSVLLFFSKEEFYRPSRLFQERWSKRWFFSAAVII
ncbi:hypothetical protein K2X05_00895, partial [bacterium]|nr:hypothetical protein [bacterium]